MAPFTLMDRARCYRALANGPIGMSDEHLRQELLQLAAEAEADARGQDASAVHVVEAAERRAAA